jgi:GNAT superfamily N-acetyltransferase
VAWRKLAAADLPVVVSLSHRIHAGHPEDPEVFEERLKLYPDGCFVCEHDGNYVGYAISHPWHRDSPPRLNARLHRVPDDPDIYYFHDIALLPAAQRQGWGTQIIEVLKRHALQLGLHAICLVAVNRSESFWQGNGFRAKDVPGLRQKLLTYGAVAVYMECLL